MNYKHENREEGIPYPGDYLTNQEYYDALKAVADSLKAPSSFHNTHKTMNTLFQNYENAIIEIAPDTFAAERLLRPYLMVRVLIDAEVRRTMRPPQLQLVKS